MRYRRTSMLDKALGTIACLLLVLDFGGTDARAATAAKLAPGDTPPPSLGTNLAGDDVDTGRYAGKVLVVTFWASWCAPCRKELPMLEGIQQAAGKDNVQVVAINIEDREIYRKLARRLGSLTLRLNHDAGKRSSEAYGVHGIPHL